jgi:hypothetical protein
VLSIRSMFETPPRQVRAGEVEKMKQMVMMPFPKSCEYLTEIAIDDFSGTECDVNNCGYFKMLPSAAKCLATDCFLSIAYPHKIDPQKGHVVLGFLRCLQCMSASVVENKEQKS